ncbi:hypothetical protein F5Y16DRAFT_365323 [Xylariaceae sp. FL0255]|nr:hypothetical protein F5Y16DRAFT_365323 [Xylariaceae sp. FL0255]
MWRQVSLKFRRQCKVSNALSGILENVRVLKKVINEENGHILQQVRVTLESCASDLRGWLQHNVGVDDPTLEELGDWVIEQDMASLMTLQPLLQDMVDLSGSMANAFDPALISQQCVVFQRHIDLLKNTAVRRTIRGSAILCFDGGGIKSLTSLLVLKRLMEYINLEAAEKQLQKTPGIPLKPCEIFDYVYGSSSGGLIAIMLGRLEMSIDECIKTWRQSTTTILSQHRRSWFGLPAVFPPRYKSEVLARIVNKVTDEFDPTDEDDRWRRNTYGNPQSQCKTGVLATDLSTGLPYIFRTFRCDISRQDQRNGRIRMPLNPGPSDLARIEEVARATSAAPAFFAPMNINNRSYVDGGLSVNNPSEQAIRDVGFLRHDDLSRVCLVSLGSGKTNSQTASSRSSRNIFRRLRRLMRMLENTANQTEAAHRTTRETCRDNDVPYFRINPVLGNYHRADIIGVNKLAEDLLLSDMDHELRKCATAVVSCKLRQLPTTTASTLSSKLSQTVKKEYPFIVPFSRNHQFVGRDVILRRVDSMITPRADRDNCQWTVLVGLGGIGKTQIALEAAYRMRARNEGCSIFWVPAIDTRAFESAYHDIGHRLNVRGIDEDGANIKALVKAALSRDDTGEWLLILDNVDDGELFLRQFSDYIPHNLNGSILCTTRSREICVDLGVPLGNIVEVPQLDETEALRLLQINVAGAAQNDPDDLITLLSLLDGLPLAIVQASQYISRTAITVSQYLHLLQSSDEAALELLNQKVVDRGRYRSYSSAVIATWDTAFDQIFRDNPRAMECMGQLCLFDPGYIPTELLNLEGFSEMKTLEAIGKLTAYGFIRQVAGNMYQVHRLVQFAMQQRLRQEGELGKFSTIVFRQLADKFPNPKDTKWDIIQMYFAHALAVMKFKEYCESSDAKALLLSHIGRFLVFLGKYDEAEPKYEEAQAVDEAEHGKHGSSLQYLQNLAFLFQKQGKLEEAEKMQRQILQDQRETLGSHHPSTLDSMSNLALVYNDQRRFEDARRQELEVWHMKEEVLGSEHPATLKSMTRLAEIYTNQGLFREAESLGEKVLAMRERVLGLDQPYTLASMADLLSTYRLLGRLKEAVEIGRRLLYMRGEDLGEAHPDTLDTMSELALVYKSLDQLEEANRLETRESKLREMQRKEKKREEGAGEKEVTGEGTSVGTLITQGHR